MLQAHGSEVLFLELSMYISVCLIQTFDNAANISLLYDVCAYSLTPAYHLYAS